MILLLEPDDDTRPLLKGNLEARGYTILVALNETDAIARATYARSSLDLIVINQVDQPIAEIIAKGQRIRREAGLSESIPVVVLAERYSLELEGQNLQFDEYNYVAYLEDGQQLLDLLKSLLST